MIGGDITDPAHRAELARAADDGLDLLVNNAGTLGAAPLPALADYPLDELRDAFEANVVAPLALTQLLLPALRVRSRRVLNITSDAAVEPYAGWGGYGATKAALEQASAVLAAEESSIRVWWADPGDLRTRMHQAAFPGEDISDRPEPETVVPGFAQAGRAAAAERPVPDRGAALTPPATPSNGLFTPPATPSTGLVTPPTTPSTGLFTPPATPSTGLMNFDLPAVLEAREPPEARGLARDGVRLMVSRTRAQTVTHHPFTDMPSLLLPGDLLVVNTSRTLPAAVRAGDLEVHFSGQLPNGAWLAEFRQASGKSSLPNGTVEPGRGVGLPGGASLRVVGPAGARLWQVRASVAVVPYLLRHGFPIRYSYAAEGQWPLAAYQTVFGTVPGQRGDAERGPPVHARRRDRAGGARRGDRPRHAALRRVVIGGGRGPLPRVVRGPSRHCPAGERDPAIRWPGDRGRNDGGAGAGVRRGHPAGARTAARHTRHSVSARTGWTSHVVTPETGVRVVDGLLTGLHEPRSSHLRMLAAFHPEDLLERCYEQALAQGYLWHEFGDVHLMLP